MDRRKFSRIAIAGALALSLVGSFSLVGCGSSSTDTSDNSTDTTDTSAESVELTVQAAASLTDAMDEAYALYHEENPNVTITFNYGASGTLAEQIVQGAECDLFFSANTKNMDSLEDADLLEADTRINLFKNDLVLVTPTGSTTVTSFEDLANDDVAIVALGDPEAVPAGKYAEQTLDSLGILDAVSAKATYGKDVREVLSYVETGDADAGIVYKTDALTSDSVQIVATADASSHDEIVYPAAVLSGSANVDAAGDFLDWLSTDEATAIFESYGFQI